jgi:hypothetical protein
MRSPDDRRAEALPHPRQLGLQHRSIGKLQQAETVGCRDREHGTERRRQSAGDQWRHTAVACSARQQPEQFLEGIAKTGG